jgi:hypothetical protein
MEDTIRDTFLVLDLLGRGLQNCFCEQQNSCVKKEYPEELNKALRARTCGIIWFALSKMYNKSHLIK